MGGNGAACQSSQCESLSSLHVSSDLKLTLGSYVHTGDPSHKSDALRGERGHVRLSQSFRGLEGAPWQLKKRTENPSKEWKMEGGEGWQQAKDTQEDGDISTLGLTVDADIHFAYTFLDVSVKRQAA